MKVITHLALKSVLNRKATAILTILTVAVSVILLLGVERVRTEAKSSFANTISGTDLIVGGRSGQVNLLLYSVFRIGNATNNIDWKSYEEFSQHNAVKWAIPISLGDSHKKHPICCDVYPRMQKKELLIIAAIFHDIGKGRGGDHSVIGHVVISPTLLRVTCHVKH